MRVRRIGLAAVFSILAAGGAQALTLSSPAFKDMQPMPLRFTQTGAGPSTMQPAGGLSAAVSPPLQWSNVPPGAKSFTLLLYDHFDTLMWAVVNIPGDARSLPEAIPNGGVSAKLPKGAWQRSFRSNGWLGMGGGKTPDFRNTYFWKLYPLDAALPLPEDANYAQIVAAMEGHLIGDKAVMITPCCDGSM